jgi:hypothetical protein
MSYQPYPGGGSYQPYPSGGNEMLQRPTPPKSIQNAVKLMYAGAGLSALSLIIGLATVGSLKNAIRQAAINNHKPLTTSQLHTAEVAGVAIIVILGLIGIGLWLWMARTNGAGKMWARVVASVLFGLSTISAFYSLARPNSAAEKIFEILVWLIGLGAIVLLYQRDSTAYYNSQSAPR